MTKPMMIDFKLPEGHKELMENLELHSFIVHNPDMYGKPIEEIRKAFEAAKNDPRNKNHKIYNKMDEWYHPEIPYMEMVENFRWTKQYKSLFENEFPLTMAMLLHHATDDDYTTGERGKQQMFQFWNKEFNDELAKIIKFFKPKLVLDVCAGDGMLAKLMSDRGINIKAVDNYTWKFDKRYFDVEKLDYKKALEKYQPDFVIGCWMNYGTDYTPDFRRTKSVKHYMMIGEVGGCTGGNWDTRKGWMLKDWDEANQYALSRTDMLDWDVTGKPTNFGIRHHASVITMHREESLFNG